MNLYTSIQETMELTGEVFPPKLKEFTVQYHTASPAYEVQKANRVQSMKEKRKEPSRRKKVNELLNDSIGFGPINSLLLDDAVSEIMVNAPDQVYCERNGKLILTDVHFRDNEQVMKVIERIVTPLGQRIDQNSSIIDARFPDGSRVNAILPPLALNGPTFTIKKSAKKLLQLKDLIHFGTLTEEAANYLENCVTDRLNVIVSGGIGSGKTNTLNVLSNFISENERIVTIEDTRELRLRQNHVTSFELGTVKMAGKDEKSIHDIINASLKMRPNRLIIDEMRGGEALDILQEMNSGYNGVLAASYAGSPKDLISRIETMVLLAGLDLPMKEIREQIAGGINVIIQQSRLNDGSRRITNITEVQGMKGDRIVLQDMFTFYQDQEGVNSEGAIIGHLVPTGVRSQF